MKILLFDDVQHFADLGCGVEIGYETLLALGSNEPRRPRGRQHHHLLVQFGRFVLSVQYAQHKPKVYDGDWNSFDVLKY